VLLKVYMTVQEWLSHHNPSFSLASVAQYNFQHVEVGGGGPVDWKCQEGRKGYNSEKTFFWIHVLQTFLGYFTTLSQ
jgi:hypothetical protein